METTDKIQKNLDAIIQMLKFAQEETETILKKNSVKPLQRQLKKFESLLDEFENLKVQMQKLKFTNGEEPQDVRSWSLEIDGEITTFEDTIDAINDKIDAFKEEAAREERQREEDITELRRQRQLERDIKLEEEKMKIKRELERKMDEEREKSHLSKGQTPKAKLPKLVITKFQGTHIDWPRFWSQFEAEIDCAEIGQVAKFSYLKELLIPKVRLGIDGLPFTTEGYERAKQILKTRYGKPSEVANAYIQNLLSLPQIHGTSPSKLHEFYQNLVTNVQVLETMGKLREVTGYVRLTWTNCQAFEQIWSEWMMIGKNGGLVT
eukprot:gene16264-biopygen13817